MELRNNTICPRMVFNNNTIYHRMVLDSNTICPRIVFNNTICPKIVFNNTICLKTVLEPSMWFSRDLCLLNTKLSKVLRDILLEAIHPPTT